MDLVSEINDDDDEDGNAVTKRDCSQEKREAPSVTYSTRE